MGSDRRRPRADVTETVLGVDEVPARRPGDRDHLTLVGLIGEHAQPLVPIDGSVAIVGRGPECDVHLNDPGLSRRHARLFKMDGAWWVEDLQSRNGTFLQGQRLARPARLSDGDRLQVGRGSVFRVSLHDAIEHQATRRLYESAVKDPLTGAYNRRHLDERLAQELAYAQRHGTFLSLVLLDVDHFKAINDAHGHPAGDAVLAALGGLLAETVGAEDLVARYGGEEFAVVARGIGAENARRFGERVRVACAALAVCWEDVPLQVRVSIGVATHGPERAYPTVEELVAAADAALYRAKDGGRDRVCADAEPSAAWA